MTDINNADVVIIGGGPAGCSCALYTARSNLSTIILDKNPAVGALAITHKIANYPGVAGDASGEELLKTMRNQAISYGISNACSFFICLDGGTGNRYALLLDL